MVDFRTTPTTGTGGTQQTGEVNETRTKGTGGTQNPGTDTSPAPVTKGETESKPQNSQPKIDPKDVAGNYQRVLSLLSSHEPVDESSLMTRLLELKTSIENQQMSTQKDQLNSTKDQISANTKAIIEKIKDAGKEAQSQKTWDTIKTVFSVVATVILAVASVASIIATAGLTAAAVGPAMLAVGGATLSILQTTGMTDKIFDAIGIKDPNWRMGIMIGISVVMAVAGGIGAVKSIVQSGAQEALKTGGNLAFRQALGTISKFGNIIGGGAKIGEGVNQIGSSVAGYRVEEITYDRKILETSNLRQQKIQEELVDDIKKLVEQIESGARIVAQVVESQHTSVQTQMRHMS